MPDAEMQRCRDDTATTRVRGPQCQSRVPEMPQSDSQRDSHRAQVTSQRWREVEKVRDVESEGEQRTVQRLNHPIMILTMMRRCRFTLHRLKIIKPISWISEDMHFDSTKYM
jgi:hypothetical protein